MKRGATSFIGLLISVSTIIMVNLHGTFSITVRQYARSRGGVRASKTMGIHEVPERPPDPSTLLSTDELQYMTRMLLDWWKGKNNVLCLTGAGISTESGIPDYRGHGGSYHRGHKPMIHDQFMQSEYQRKRYWGRGMIGWREFDQTQPNSGHYALANLERMGKIGVTFNDRLDFHPPEMAKEAYYNNFLRNGGKQQQKMSVVTQNVDSLHRRAGSQYITELHGRNDIVQCMHCGSKRSRQDFHTELERYNKDWLIETLTQRQENKYNHTATRDHDEDDDDDDLRADGDAEILHDDFESIHVPPCSNCGIGFYKPSVVFFGDSVPKYRVNRVNAAFDAADGVLVIGSSLAVHSAYRHIRKASMEQGIPIALLNVGETRAEREGLENILKIEAPTGPVLESTVDHFQNHP